MDLFNHESRRRVGENNVLRRIDALIDRGRIFRLLKGGLKRTGLEPQGYDPMVLFRCLLLRQWHGLSDPKLEESPRVRLDFMSHPAVETGFR